MGKQGKGTRGLKKNWQARKQHAITHASHTKLNIIHYVHIVLSYNQQEWGYSTTQRTHNNRKINILVVHCFTSMHFPLFVSFESFSIDANQSIRITHFIPSSARTFRRRPSSFCHQTIPFSLPKPHYYSWRMHKNLLSNGNERKTKQHSSEAAAEARRYYSRIYNLNARTTKEKDEKRKEIYFFLLLHFFSIENKLCAKHKIIRTKTTASTIIFFVSPTKNEGNNKKNHLY